MARKKRTNKLAVEVAVQVKDEVTLPEFPEQSIAGWTGTVTEKKRRAANLKYIIEWDDATVEAMPQSYQVHRIPPQPPTSTRIAAMACVWVVHNLAHLTCKHPLRAPLWQS